MDPDPDPDPTPDPTSFSVTLKMEKIDLFQVFFLTRRHIIFSLKNIIF
jgi:hypothetical protein